MWIIYSLLAAFFSGLTTIFAKVSLKNNNSTLLTGIRTIVITIFTIIIYFVFKIENSINIKAITFIILSGISTALLWLTYFKALSLADVSLVTPVDKLSIIITLLLSNIFLSEKITLIKILSMTLIILGTFLMVRKKEKIKNDWLIYALLTALLTSITTILGKIGIKDIDPNLATMLRTIVVLIIVWSIIIIKKEYKYIHIDNKNKLFVILSGISTGLSWLLYFQALKNGEASVVFSIEKLSVVVSVLLSIIFLKEKLDKKGIVGFIIIFLSTILLLKK